MEIRDKHVLFLELCASNILVWNSTTFVWDNEGFVKLGNTRTPLVSKMRGRSASSSKCSSPMIIAGASRGNPRSINLLKAFTKRWGITDIMAYRFGSESTGSGIFATFQWEWLKKNSISVRRPSTWSYTTYSYMRYKEPKGVSELLGVLLWSVSMGENPLNGRRWRWRPFAPATEEVPYEISR